MSRFVLAMAAVLFLLAGCTEKQDADGEKFDVIEERDVIPRAEPAQPYEFERDEVVKATLYSGDNRGSSAVIAEISDTEELDKLSAIFQNAPPFDGPMTADWNYTVVVNTHDGNTKEIAIVGGTHVFVDESQNKSYSLDKERFVAFVERHKKLQAGVFSLWMGNAYLKLGDWDDQVHIEGLLGRPVADTLEVLGNAADTHSGSLLKTLDYDGLQLELFSPKQNGETFWIMSMTASMAGYRTPEDIEVGHALEDLRTAYPGIEMALDGRTDPHNGAYQIDREMYDFLRFEVEDGIISEIRIFRLLQ